MSLLSYLHHVVVFIMLHRKYHLPTVRWDPGLRDETLVALAASFVLDDVAISTLKNIILPVSLTVAGCSWHEREVLLEQQLLYDKRSCKISVFIWSVLCKTKQGLKQANTSMSVPPLASYKWAIKHKRNRKTTEKQARSNPYCPI